MEGGVLKVMGVLVVGLGVGALGLGAWFGAGIVGLGGL